MTLNIFNKLAQIRYDTADSTGVLLASGLGTFLGCDGSKLAQLHCECRGLCTIVPGYAAVLAVTLLGHISRRFVGR